MEQMWMPETIEEFLDEFAFEDEERAYTNGATLISMLRVKQAIEHYFRDVAPVVHAYWDDSGRYRFERDGSLAIPCSNCGCALKEDESKKYIWSYCPKCGARMDGEGAQHAGAL